MNHGTKGKAISIKTPIAVAIAFAGVLLCVAAYLITRHQPTTQLEPANAKAYPPGQPTSAGSEQAKPSQTAEPNPDPLRYSDALTTFLKRFDEIKARGFVKTQRSGSTGIGYTLESLLGLKENNDRGGDFLGMEIKAYRDSEAELDDAEKMNLFLKEPKWLDNLRTAERIRTYGYVDKNGRNALYSTVTLRENSHGFRFEIDNQNSQLFLVHKDKRIGKWDFATLQNRLKEKHTEAVFVAAEARGTGKDEEFRYHTVTWCRQPSVSALIKLIGTRDVMLELRMHVKENGSARNHGTAFRVHKNKLNKLFATTVRCR